MGVGSSGNIPIYLFTVRLSFSRLKSLDTVRRLVRLRRVRKLPEMVFRVRDGWLHCHDPIVVEVLLEVGVVGETGGQDLSQLQINRVRHGQGSAAAARRIGRVGSSHRAHDALPT